MNILSARSATVLLACIALAGCRDSNSKFLGTTGPVGLPIDLTASWVGSWTNSVGDSGFLTGDFVQAEVTSGGGPFTTLSGSVTFEDSLCEELLVVAASVNPGSFTSASSLSGSFTGPTLTIDFRGAIATGSDIIGGSYEVVSTGICAGETGSFQLSKLVARTNEPVTRIQVRRTEDDLITTIEQVESD